MTAAIALANLIIPLLPTIGGDIASLINWINSIRSAAQQSAEWTPAMDLAYRQALIAAGEDASWIPDSTPVTPSPEIQAVATLKEVQTPPINEAGALENAQSQAPEPKVETSAPAPAAEAAPGPSYSHTVGS